jgi:superfamily II DNA or RNA helicase
MRETDTDAELQRQRQRAIQDAADAYERQWIAHLRATQPQWEVWWWRDVRPVDLIKSGLSVVYTILKRSHKIEYGLDGLAYDKDTNTYYFLQFKMRTGIATMQPGVFGTFLGVMGVMKHLRTDEGARDRHAGFDATSKVRGIIGTSIPFSQDTQRINTLLGVESHVLAPEDLVVVPPPAPEVATEYVLRDYQHDAIDALRAAKDHHHVTSIVMPCGVGKTYTMLASMDAPTLVVVPFLDHCKQLREKARKVCVPRLEVSGIGTRVPAEVAAFVAEGGPRCVVTTRTSFREVLAKLEGVRFASVFFDEAHHILKEERDAALNLAPSLTLVTATPPHNTKTDACWRDAFPAYRMAWEEAITRNFIVPPRLLFPLIRDRADDDDEDEGSYTWETRARWFLDASRAHRGITNAFVYVNNTAHVDAMVNALHAAHDPQRHRPLRRCRFVAVTHKTHSKTRAALYKDMEDNTHGDALIVFVSVFVLDEGVDVNACDAIFLAELPDDEGATFSIEPTRLVQRACRANRVTPRKECATILAWCPSASRAAEVVEMMEVGMGTGTDIVRVEALALDALDGEDTNVVVEEVQHTEAVTRDARKRLERRRAKEASGIAATEHANLLRSWVDRAIAWRDANGKRWADEVRGAPKEEVRVVAKLRGRHGANSDDARRRLEKVDGTFFDPYMVRAARLVIEHTLRRHRANGERGLVAWPAQSDETRFDLRFHNRAGFNVGTWFSRRAMERRNGELDPTVASMLDAVDETWWMEPVTRTIAALEAHWDASRNAVPIVEGSTPYGPAERGLVLDGKWVHHRRSGVKHLLGLVAKTNTKITWSHLRRLLRIMPTFMDTRQSAKVFGEAGFMPFLKERLGLARDASAADLDAALARKAAAEDEKAEGEDASEVGMKRKRHEG